jgi:hypothetical protein
MNPNNPVRGKANAFRLKKDETRAGKETWIGGTDRAKQINKGRSRAKNINDHHHPASKTELINGIGSILIEGQIELKNDVSGFHIQSNTCASSVINSSRKLEQWDSEWYPLRQCSFHAIFRQNASIPVESLGPLHTDCRIFR